MRRPDRESKRAAALRALRRGDDLGQMKRAGIGRHIILSVADEHGIAVPYERTTGIGAVVWREPRRKVA